MVRNHEHAALQLLSGTTEKCSPHHLKIASSNPDDTTAIRLDEQQFERMRSGDFTCLEGSMRAFVVTSQ